MVTAQVRIAFSPDNQSTADKLKQYIDQNYIMPIELSLQADPSLNSRIQVVLVKGTSPKTVWNQKGSITESSFGNIITNIKRANI